MKKILIGILFLFFTHQATAQLPAIRNYGFRLGLTAYPTFGMINPEEGESKGTNLGFAYGLMADFNFAERYSFNTGLTITTINGKSREINALPYHAMVSSTAPITYDLKWFAQFDLSNRFAIKARQDAKIATGVLADDRNSAEWTRFYCAGLVIGGGGLSPLQKMQYEITLFP